MAKPMQLTIVSAVPLILASAFWATRVENIGESAMTTIPQNNKKLTNRISELILKTKGETKQHRHDKSNAKKAVILAPIRCEI